METSAEQTVYQFYTIVNSPHDDLALENQLLQENLYEVGDEDVQDSQVMYITLPQEDEEEEEPPASEDMFSTVEDSSGLPEEVGNVKIEAFEDGELYLTTDNSSDNLTAVQPYLLTNIVSAPTELQSESGEEQLEDNTETEDYHEIQLEDGTCAIIDSELLNSLVKIAPQKELPDMTKKRYPCMYLGCGKSFTTSHHLIVHMRCHTGTRPYACTYEGCEKAFATGYSLKAHLRTHTGEKPYSCNVCTKSFKTSGDLQKHLRIHTGEKPFKCPVEGCDKSFTTSNIRKVHIRSHTGERPYMCQVVDCGKAFASATNYKNHMRIHSGEKPYVCQVVSCGKRFTEYSSLYKHSAVHHPFREFKCKFCSSYFKSEHSRNIHQKSVHNTLTELKTEFVAVENGSKPLVVKLCDPYDLRPADPLLLSPNDVNEDCDDNM